MKKNLTTLIIILSLLTVLFFALIFALSSQKTEIAEAPLIKTPTKSTETERKAVLSFSESYLEVKKGEQFKLDVLLDAEKDVYGVDVFLEYDSDLIEMNSITANSEIGNLVKSKREYPENQIAFSVLAPAQKTFTGKIKIAELSFLAKQAGIADIKFVADNSHVAGQNGKDILGETQNAKVKIISN